MSLGGDVGRLPAHELMMPPELTYGRHTPQRLWKRQLLDGARALFTRGKQKKDKDEGQVKEAELFQRIGRLKMELEWINKASAAWLPENCACWSITTTPRSASVGNTYCWGWF